MEPGIQIYHIGKYLIGELLPGFHFDGILRKLTSRSNDTGFLWHTFIFSRQQG